MKKNVKMAFTEHLDELRTRLIISISTLLVLSVIPYVFHEEILKFIKSLADIDLISISPAEGMFSTIKLSFYCGILLSLPVFIYQTLKFVIPALSKKERKFIIIATFISVILFNLGVFFSIKFAVPFMLSFFIGFLPSDIVQSLISYDKYISFIFRLVIVFGIIFLEPLIIVSVVKLGIISIKKLSKLRPYFIIVNLIFAAIITPPDIVSQIIMAIPLMIFFEIGLIVSRILLYKKS